ncbi:MAG: APC family permease [Halioglobus sp.]
MTERRTVSVPSAIALGVGSMVGAGIFALLGEAAALAGSAVWISFLVASIIAMLTGYSFVQMGVRFPSRGGVVEYLVQGYGPGLFSGACSILFYIAQLIGMAMIALAFGKYSAKLIGFSNHLDIYERVFASGLIVGLAALQLVGSRLIGQIQRFIVITNLILLSVVAIGLSTFSDATRLSVETWPSTTPVLGSLALTFFAFTGFAVLGNSVEDMKNPAKDLPRAMFGTIVIVTVLYLGLAVATTAAVSHEQLVSSGPLLLINAARSAFGDVGFTVLLISAIVATVTCVNGGLYGTTRITYALAEEGQLPARFGQQLRASTRGLTISAGVAVIMLNAMDLATVASLGSATSLLVYFLVNLGALRVIKGSTLSRSLIFLSVLACLLAIVIWFMYTIKYAPVSLGIFISFVLIALATESLLQRVRGRKIMAQQG